MFTQTQIGVTSQMFMHGIFVARDGFNFTQRRTGFQQGSGIDLEAVGIVADARSGQFAFADA
ncbi:Uncharacterised protein [Edwardsiella tarda]|nr:Uncharacterised protein [Edwardsiella tarda]